MGLGELFEWLQDQIQYVLFIALFVLVIVTAFKRQWIAMAGVILGLSFIAIFIINPEMLIDLGEWFSGILNLGEE